MNEFNPVKIAVGAIGTILVLSLVFGSFGIVNPGERGIRVRLGIIAGTLEQGPYFKLPFLEQVVKMDVQTQSFVATKEEPLTAASNDLQDTRMAVVVNYKVNTTSIVDIYQQYKGTENYYSSIVEPLVISTVKATASQYTAAEQIQKRAEMSEKAYEALVKAFEGKNIVIEKADITNIQFSPEFTQAIERKVTAVQDAETEKNNLEKEKYKADQRVAQAKGEAEAIRIQAQAITQQGGEDYVKLQAIKGWDGHGCTSNCFGQGTQMPIPFFNVSK